MNILFNKITHFAFAKIVNWRTLSKFRKIYGKFLYFKKSKNYSFSLKNESQVLFAEVVKMVLDLIENPKRVLLPGENNLSKEQIKIGLNKKLEGSEIVTTGLSDNVDYKWNFELPPPPIGKFSLIISQAMLEHLIDPYKHIKDLSNYLEKRGYLIVHTVLPGFVYHRYPIDTLRFHPDWFEEIAKPNRCNLKIVKKYIRNFHIFYMYKKL